MGKVSFNQYSYKDRNNENENKYKLPWYSCSIIVIQKDRYPENRPYNSKDRNQKFHVTSLSRPNQKR